MESNEEIIDRVCVTCGKNYQTKIPSEESCKDDNDRSWREFYLSVINRNPQCDSCIEEEERKEAEWQRKKELNNKLKQIPFSTDFERAKATDSGVLADWIWTNRKHHLWIAGDYGCGKTRSLCCILGQLIKQGRKCRYITCNDLLSKYGCKSQESGKVEADRWLEGLLEYDFLAVDDIGKKKISMSGGEGLYNLLDYRYSGRGHATIYLTANLSGKEIARKFEDADTGAAFRSRLLRLEFLPWITSEKTSRYGKEDEPRKPYKEN